MHIRYLSSLLQKSLPGILLKTSRRFTTHTASMAKSRFEYVRMFEQPDSCLPNCWIVVRVDGKGFHKFSDKHNFTKPNDDRSLKLMSHAAERVMTEFRDIILAYGQSDEYSFVFRKNTETYNRRASKLMSNVVALFASSFVYHWKDHFGQEPLLYPPAFDSRVVLYPTDQNLRDYLSWRQADCHINNLYNTCFWALVQNAGFTTRDAQEELKGTVSGEKNELLFSKFSINYNEIPELYRKGTTLVKEKIVEEETKTVPDGEGTKEVTLKKTRSRIVALNCDIIGKTFWNEHPELLGIKS